MSSCSGKIRYRSKRVARDAKRHAQSEFGVKMYVYPCSACRGWHLTKMRRSTFRRMQREIEVDSEGEQA